MSLTFKRDRHERLLRMMGVVLTLLSGTGFVEASQPVEMVTIIGRGSATVEKDLILLADLVQIKGHDDQLVNQLAGIKIAKAPGPGRSKKIDLSDIRLRLRQHRIDQNRIEFHFDGPVTVRRDQMEISVELIEEAIRKFLVDHSPWPKNETIIKNVRFSGPIRLPAGTLDYRIEAPKNTDYLGPVSLDVWFYINDRFQKRISVSAQIEVFADVVVAKNPIGKYETIQKQDVAQVRAELSRLPNRPASSVDEVVGKRALFPIYPHTMIGPDDVELPPVVRRGDVVKIIAQSAGLCVTARGMIKETGRVGERVQVVNMDSQKTLHAEVLDVQTVKIDF